MAKVYSHPSWRKGSRIFWELIFHPLPSGERKSCREQNNVSFVQLDLTRDALPGRFDLIVCGEVLYFMGGRRELERVACKLARSLVDNGFLLMAHMNLLKESPQESGFDWNVAYGAKTIGELFQETYPLRLIREMKFPLYRLHLFQRQPMRAYLFGSASPEIAEIQTQPTELSPELEAHVRWAQNATPRHNRASPPRKYLLLSRV